MRLNSESSSTHCKTTTASIERRHVSLEMPRWTQQWWHGSSKKGRLGCLYAGLLWRRKLRSWKSHQWWWFRVLGQPGVALEVAASAQHFPGHSRGREAICRCRGRCQFSCKTCQGHGRQQPVCRADLQRWQNGLFFKMLPDRTLAMKNDARKAEGYKLAKDRTTVLFCVNKTSTHKLKPLCIGKYAKPRCFHHVNLETMPLAYTASGNAWMTAAIFTEWFKKSFVPNVKRHLRECRLEEKAQLPRSSTCGYATFSWGEHHRDVHAAKYHKRDTASGPGNHCFVQAALLPGVD